MTGKEENALIKRTFKGNRELLQLVQSAMLGLDLTAQERKILRDNFAGTEIMKVVRKRFMPQITKDTPVGQMQDPWGGVEEMIFGRDPQTIQQALLYKEGAIEWTAKALERLEDPEKDGVSIGYEPKLYPNDPLGINLLVRNQFIKHVQTTLSILWVLAENNDEETPQQTAQRLQRDSMQ